MLNGILSEGKTNSRFLFNRIIQLKRSRSPIFSELKLEIDKGLQVGGDELVDDENAADDGKQHGPEGQHGERKLVTCHLPLWEDGLFFLVM